MVSESLNSEDMRLILQQTPRTQDGSENQNDPNKVKWEVYTRPGKIWNQSLLKDTKAIELKSCLSEMYDFVVVKYDAW